MRKIQQERLLSAPIEEEIPLPSDDELYEEAPREAPYPEPEPPQNELLTRAKNIETPAHELTSLFETESFHSNTDSEIHKLIALNPNTPKNLLLTLGYRYPLQMMTNPSFELLFLENPAFFKEIPYDTRQAILREVASAPRWLIEVMIKGYASQLAQRKETPAWALSYIARAESSVIRYNAACNPNLPEEAMWRLMEDPDESVRRAIARNPSRPEELALSIAQSDEPTLRINLAESPTCTDQLSQILARDPHPPVRSAVAKSTKDLTLLLALSQDKSPGVVSSVAKNPKTPLELLSQLATHPNAAVRFAVTGNIHVRDNLLKLLGEAPNPIISLLQNNSPEQAGYWRELFSLLSPPMDWSWARSSFVLARQIVARNTANTQIIRELSKDTETEVLFELARNTKIQPETLSKIIPRLPIEALIKLAKICDLPLQVANFMARGELTQIKKTNQIAFHFDVPTIRHDNTQLKLALAGNLYCGPSTIEILCADSDPEVRALAETRRAHPEEFIPRERQEEPEGLEEIPPSELSAHSPLPEPDDCLLDDLDEEELDYRRFQIEHPFEPYEE